MSKLGLQPLITMLIKGHDRHTGARDDGVNERSPQVLRISHITLPQMSQVDSVRAICMLQAGMSVRQVVRCLRGQFQQSGTTANQLHVVIINLLVYILHSIHTVHALGEVSFSYAAFTSVLAHVCTLSCRLDLKVQLVDSKEVL